MPTITVEGPKMDYEKKKELGTELYKIAKRIYGIDSINVVIKENDPENVCVNGVMVCEMLKKKR